SCKYLISLFLSSASIPHPPPLSWSLLFQKMGEGFWVSVATDAGALVFAGQQQPATLSEFFLLHAGEGGR
ncbi:MAG: hypothetical protein ACO3XI_17245, partial [bacterium]